MSPAHDSLAQIAIELAHLLDPLSDEVAPPGTKRFFAQLGIALTDAQAAALGAPASAAASATTQLAAVVGDLIAAIDASAETQIALKGGETVARLADVVARIDALATSVHGLGLAGVTATPEQLAKGLFDLLVGRYLGRLGSLNDALEFAGLLHTEDHEPADSARPPYTLYDYDFAAIGEWLSDPTHKAQTLLGWGVGFDGALLFERLEKLLAMTGVPVIYHATASPKRLDVVVLELAPTTSGPAGVVIRLKAPLLAAARTIRLGDDADIEVSAAFQPPTGTQITLHTAGQVAIVPPSPTPLSGALGAKLTIHRDAPRDAFVIFGVAGASRLEFRRFVIDVHTTVEDAGGSATGLVDASAALSGGKVVVDTTSGDGFLAKLLPGTRFEGDFDLLMGISTARGLYFGGSGGLELRLPAHIDLGPVSIEALTIAAHLEGGHVVASVGADIRALLGPIEATVQNIGVTATISFPPGNAGNLGPLQLDIGFKPPTGVGLRVDAGPITGGGFLSIDVPKGEYIGALELSFEGLFTLKAVGIINTKMPDGSKGFALLILVTAEFAPVQLGFGFTLLGVGGLLGLNRSLDSEALRQGVRSGSITSVLFPPDVVGNIARIVSDLKSFFPIVQGHFVIAPMGKIGWGTPTLISLELGIIIDIPSPQLTIIGVLRCILPEEDAPILRLQVAFAGGIDFDRGLIWFDASLFDSNILVFTLSGDMALRIGWGDEPMFVISVGGFHPAFHEVPPDLTGMRRLTIALLSGDNPRLVAQTYFAVTSNTVQSGSRVELYAEACGLNVFGYLGYDLLIQFDPFHFVAQISAGLALRSGDDVIAGIEVFCELSGPTPWHAVGHASLKILFFKIRVGFDVTWGDDAPALPPATEDVLSLVVAAVRDDRNWVADMPANASQTVTLRSIAAPADTIMLHPFGVLSVSQKVAPLGLAIDRFGNKQPAGDRTFAMTWGGGASEELREEFAIANFVTLSDSEKIARKSFEKLKSGLRFAAGDATAMGATVHKDVSYELSYVHRKRTRFGGIVKLVKSMFDTMTAGGAIARCDLSVAKRRAGGNGPAPVEIAGGEYHVVKVSDLSLAVSGATARTQAEAYALHDELVREDPSLAGAVQVVAAHELVGA